MSPMARRAVERALVVASLVRAHPLAREEVRDLAVTDSLTGLGNSDSLTQSLEERVKGAEQPALLYLDLDGFERVNDELGRLSGDAVLRVTARRLAAVMRPTDELVRVRDDEFAVLCNGEPTREQMVMIAERVIRQLSRPLSIGNGITVDVGASVGIICDHPAGTSVDDLLSHARQALADAKEKGGNQWAVVTPQQ
jgi:diguanylate cyclase (GGDEF)-like protein